MQFFLKKRKSVDLHGIGDRAVAQRTHSKASPPRTIIYAVVLYKKNTDKICHSGQAIKAKQDMLSQLLLIVLQNEDPQLVLLHIIC